MRVSQRRFHWRKCPSFGVTRDEGRQAQPRDGSWEQGQDELQQWPASDQPPRRKKGFMSSRRTRGFSLIEMMVVVALILIVLAFSIMAIQPALKQGHLTQGYNQTLMALRQARDFSVAQRQIYYVTLNNAVQPNTITITQGSTGTVVSSFALPTDVAFDAEPGLPNSPLVAPTTPDGFGTGADCD